MEIEENKNESLPTDRTQQPSNQSVPTWKKPNEACCQNPSFLLKRTCFLPKRNI